MTLAGTSFQQMNERLIRGDQAAGVPFPAKAEEAVETTAKPILQQQLV